MPKKLWKIRGDGRGEVSGQTVPGARELNEGIRRLIIKQRYVHSLVQFW